MWEALKRRRLEQEIVQSMQEDLGVVFQGRLTSRSSSGPALVNALHGTGRDWCSVSRAGWMLCAKLSLVSFPLRAFFIHETCYEGSFGGSYQFPESEGLSLSEHPVLGFG